MILTELGAVAQAALPLAVFRAHLRLPQIVAEPGAPEAPDVAEEVAALEAALRAALAAIEARTAKVLLAREFRLDLAHWRDGAVQALPVAPVVAITALVLRDRVGVASPVAADRYALEGDMHRPRLAARGALLPTIPRGGRVEVRFQAGFGPGWDDLPPDLARAVLMLAAQFWEERHAGAHFAAGAALPFGVAALVERWRTVRVLGGRPGSGEERA